MATEFPEWDRSHEYVIERFFHEQARVTVQFASQSPNVAELMALRRLVNCFSH
jgi:hypothetical protein